MVPPPEPTRPTPAEYYREEFTAAETAVLSRFFTNTTEPVFALINLPEVVKGALFARYSRTTRSLRRLFLDEFHAAPELGIAHLASALEGDETVRLSRAEGLYEKVFTEFGDDSVAQLGSAHLACEQASNVLTKVLERGRLASYLEQSTRYLRFDRPLGGRHRYFVPPEVAASPLAGAYRETLDGLFGTYSGLLDALEEHYRRRYPPDGGGEGDAAYRASLQARACDDLRGLLPAATLSNLGIHASGQAFEALLLRMRAHPLAEARDYADRMLGELRKVIPAFVRRVDRPDRGGAWSRYLEDTARAMEELASRLPAVPEPRPEVTLVDWDPDAEAKVAAAALYPYTDLPDDQLLQLARGLPAEEVAELIAAYAGQRGNRRHKPGRGMERVGYRFDLLCDYGIFRDLQRHRILTIDWQRLGTAHGFVVPEGIEEAGAGATWQRAMEQAGSLHARLREALGPDAAQYAVPLAYRIRFCVQLNAREAFHLLELRTQAGGHPGYRRVCARMHRLIAEQAGHRAIAAAMSFVDPGAHDLGRLEAERRAEARRREAAGG